MATKKYSPEIKERGVRLVREARSIDPSDRSVISRISRQLGVGPESLRTWVTQSFIDEGKAPGRTTEESAELKELKREVHELRRTNEILKLASAFCAPRGAIHPCGDERTPPLRRRSGVVKLRAVEP